MAVDGYKLLREAPLLRMAVERMARVKIVFEADLAKEEEDEGDHEQE